MKKTNDEIEIAIARAVRAIPHQAPDQLWNIPVTQAEGSEWFLDSTDSINARYSIMSMAAALRTVALAAALLVITFGLRYYLRDTRNLATIYLDINPSVSLSVNRNERVTNATAGNADGEKILAEMDLKGTDVDVAVNALIGASIRYGCLDSENAILLLSFDCANKEFQNVLQTRLTMQASDNLTQELGGGTVLDMEVSPDDSIDDLSTTYGISPGKAALLAKIVTDHPDLSMDTMAAMSMSELARYLLEMDIDLRDYTDHHGEGFFEDLYKELLNDVYTGEHADPGPDVPHDDNAAVPMRDWDDNDRDDDRDDDDWDDDRDDDDRDDDDWDDDDRDDDDRDDNDRNDDDDRDDDSDDDWDDDDRDDDSDDDRD